MSGDGEEECPEDHEASTGDFCLTEEQAASLEREYNVAITAGAGTGKTTVLTERYVSILEAEPDIGPEEIVTITFTNDAANELQDRIRSAVEDRLSSASQSEYERWRTVKDDLVDGYIHTIHGFCSRLLREHIVDAPVTPEFEVYDQTDAAVLARDVTRDTINEQLSQDNSDVRRLARLWNRDTLEDILASLIQQRPTSDEWASKWVGKTPETYQEYIWESIHPISPSFAEGVFDHVGVREAFQTIQELEEDGVLEDISVSDDDGADTIATVIQLLEEYQPLSSQSTTRQRQRLLDELCEYLTTNAGERYSRAFNYRGSVGRWEDAGRESEQQRLESAIETLFDVIDPESLEFGVNADQTSAHYVLALVRVYDEVRTEYENAKDQQNALDYDDLVETTIDFLQSTPEIRHHLRDQFAYVMVDEVQDTDPRQWELVKLLTSEDPEEFDAQNVFLVGDEKQSIYRFRGADVTSFETARKELAAANPDDATTSRDLSGNFRTIEETLSFCNDLFDGDRLFDGLEAVYKPFEARPQALSANRKEGMDVTGQCEYLAVPAEGKEELHAQDYLETTPEFTETGDREAYAVASRLTHLFADPPRVFDEETEEIREAIPEDVTILLRSRTRLKSYERALDEFDIPYTVVSGTGYYESPEIQALLNLLRVLENPRDEIALYGVLRSPLFGFADNDLAQLKQSEENLWEALGAIGTRAEAGDELAEAYELLQHWRRLAGVHADVTAESVIPWGSLISRIIDQTGFMASIAGDERPRKAVVNVNRFREQVRRWEEAGVKTLAELRSRLELRQDIETHADEATIPEDVDGVQVRTIHSAKGLEFPIVVVPELGTEFNFGTDIDENGTVLFDEIEGGADGGTEPVIGLKSPTPEDAFADEQTLARRVVRSQVRQHERAELKRLLYVAATRTRDHLILSGITEFESGDDGYELADPQDPAEANCWRDWVQPALLDENTPEELSTNNAVKKTLGGCEYHIRRPVPSVDTWQRSQATTAPSLELDLPSPPSQTREKVLTATEYAGSLTGGLEEYLEGERHPDRSEQPGLSATTHGTIIHRIAETRLEESQWTHFAEDVARRNGEELTNPDVDRIQSHADHVINYLNDYESNLEISSIHDELSVAARFPEGRIVGDIDHLIVTSDTFHVIDYKTNDTTARSIEELAENYWPQMNAYAAALAQSDRNRSVKLVLYFVDKGEEKTRFYGPDRLKEVEAEIAENLR
ncbi:UvrD-helicase domain-containing protein [Halodesulfurarchaeum sp.]|uniref:UvrD-helicase domain-containing protein n=1 Tax=Halodesulfurarchaeum sp. TaxID=1980530 RepID=UPI002FC34440